MKRIKLKPSLARQYGLLRERLRQRRQSKCDACVAFGEDHMPETKKNDDPASSNRNSLKSKRATRKPRPFLYRPRTKPAKPARRKMKEQWTPADPTFSWLLYGKAHKRLCFWLLASKPPPKD